jgi:hypothetical protein
MAVSVAQSAFSGCWGNLCANPELSLDIPRSENSTLLDMISLLIKSTAAQFHDTSEGVLF